MTVTGDPAMGDPVAGVMAEMASMASMAVTVEMGEMAAPVEADRVVTGIVVIDAAIGAVIGGMDLVVPIEPTTAVATIGTIAGTAGTTAVTGFEAILVLGSTIGSLVGNRPGVASVAGTSSTIAQALGSGGVGTRPLA